MRVAIGSDHAGFDLKGELAECLRRAGYEVMDVGPGTPERTDYPIYADAVGQEILRGRADRGILICGSGVGACVAANKIPGIRAGTCHDTYSARQGVEHDDMNVLTLGARVIGTALARELALTFLQARFSGAERHRKRLDQVKDMERRYLEKD